MPKAKGFPFTVEKLKQIWSYDKETGKFVSINPHKNANAEGAITSQGFRALPVNGTSCLAHRLAWFYSYGEVPTRAIEHINGDKLDNRLNNLRLRPTILERRNGEKNLTQRRVREIFSYDPDTGIVTWNVSSGSRAMAGNRAGVKVESGYRLLCIDTERYFEHRLIWFYVHGKWPKHHIDHINGVRDDNRLCNLRPATNAENSRNAPLRATNKSGFKGVSWSSRRKKWHARIVKDYTTHILGYFDTVEEAANAYETAAKRLHGEFARVH